MEQRQHFFVIPKYRRGAGTRQATSIASSLGKAGRPASLGATRYELIINLKTVNARDLDVPATLFVRVDEVIE
jgi:hypothetical protein